MSTNSQFRFQRCSAPRPPWREFLVFCWAMSLVVWAPVVWAPVALHGCDAAEPQAAVPPAARDEISPGEIEFFEKRVRPVLAENCYECHSRRAEKLQAGLFADSRQGLLDGGDSGPAIAPGSPEASLLLEAVRYESYEMPPQGKLDDAVIADLERWIKMGAPWPADAGVEPASLAETSAEDPLAKAGDHWSWKPVHRPLIPAPARTDWARGNIDRFVLTAIEQHGWEPAPDADRVALIRRLYFDLIGLPPAVDQVQRWQSVPDEGWLEDLVDELLASNHFGEKWGRHWLDLVRYAETCGHEFDYPIHDAYRYRDYIIRAFNADVPYDQLLREHLAGDLLPEPRCNPLDGTNESVIGTGFWFLGESVHAPTDVRGDEVLRIDNQIDVMSKALLGITLACARCHDHKFDPLPTEDYYALAGFLQSSRRTVALLDPDQQIARQSQRLDSLDPQYQQALAEQCREQLPDALQVQQALQTLVESRFPTNLQGARDGAIEIETQLQSVLRDVSPDDVQHPLYLLSELVRAGDAGGWPAFSERVRRQIETAQAAAHKRAQQLELLTDFRAASYEMLGWRSDGFAFGRTPTEQSRWQLNELQPRLTAIHSAASNRHGPRAQGVLRSPTFTLEHPYIHYRLRGHDIRIRLIVDGYFMDEFNQLLFEDCTLDKIDTQGQFRWVTQSRDLDHYLGHRAYIEIEDFGAGEVELQRVCFSSQPAPPEAPHPLNLSLVETLAAGDPHTFCRAWANQWEAARQRIFGGQATEADCALSSALVQIGLIPGDEPALEALISQIHELQSRLPEPRHVLAMTDGTGENEHVHIRGSHKNLGAQVARREPLILGGTDCSHVPGSGRLELARRLTRPDNPLVARVIVNRLWHHLFGRGIVPTVDDFGKMGQPPSHPELLDYLACELVDQGWSLKQLIRAMVTSHTYRLSSSHPDATVVQQDPDNIWLARASVRRLEAEAIRDSILAVSGSLDEQMFGPSISTHLTPFMTGRGRPKSGPLDGDGRRSVYLEVRRNFLSPTMLVFDMPIPFNTMGRRSTSNVPAQSLTLLNDPFVHQQARRWARRLEVEYPQGDERIERIFLEAVSRRPTSAERAAVDRFLEQRAAADDTSQNPADRWAELCHAMLNVKEFVYLF